MTGHTVACELLMNIGLDDMFKLYLCDSAEYGYDKFIAQKGELNIKQDNWEDPTGEDKTYYNALPYTKVRKLRADF